MNRIVGVVCALCVLVAGLSSAFGRRGCASPPTRSARSCSPSARRATGRKAQDWGSAAAKKRIVDLLTCLANRAASRSLRMLPDSGGLDGEAQKGGDGACNPSLCVALRAAYVCYPDSLYAASIYLHEEDHTTQEGGVVFGDDCTLALKSMQHQLDEILAITTGLRFLCKLAERFPPVPTEIAEILSGSCAYAESVEDEFQAAVAQAQATDGCEIPAAILDSWDSALEDLDHCKRDLKNWVPWPWGGTT
jgi:hypothetical protein